MECVELAPAFEPRHTSDSGSKLHALHTLRETRPPLSSVCAICSVSPENLRKKTRFSPILFSAPGRDPVYHAARRGQTRPTVAVRFTAAGRGEKMLRRGSIVRVDVFLSKFKVQRSRFNVAEGRGARAEEATRNTPVFQPPSSL